MGLARIYSLSRYLGLGVAGALNVTPVGGGLTDFHRVAVLLRGGVGSSGVPRVRAMEEILAVWLPHESGERGNREALGEPIKDISRDRRRSK